MSVEGIIARTGIARIGRLMAPFEPVDTPPPDTILRFFAWSLRGAYRIIAVACVVAAVIGTFEVVSAMLLGMVIDRAVAAEGSVFAGNVPFFAAVAVFLLVIRPVGFGLWAALQSMLLLPNINAAVLTRLHRYTMGQSVTFFDNDFAGRIATKEMQASRAVAEVTIETINGVVFALASFVAAIALLIAIDWRLSLIAAVWLVAYVGFIRYFMPRIQVRSRLRAAARADVTGQVVDTITNMRTVKLFAHEDHEDRAALDAMGTYLDRGIAFGELSTIFRFLLITIAGLLPVVIVASVLLLYQSGLATAGDIAAAGTLSLRLSQMTGWVSFTLLGIYANIGEAEDGMRTLSPRHDLTDPPGAVALPPVRGLIEFDGVSFAYGRRAGGIRDVSLTIQPGEKVAIVGASGAGKSTMVAALLRLYDIEEGAIRIDGHDIRAITQESLRRQVGIVTQETAMFNRTARDNIAYGNPEATQAEVEDAARRAEAHDFILGLRDHRGRTGYDAYLGERGVKLSGGQRQRIALARAILKDAPVLVLDEATSALDSEVEASIQDALDRVIQGKTVIAIAHRLSTIAAMDRIVVMEDGQIVEQGDHATLLSRGGRYAQFWQRQSGGFLGEAAE